LSIDKQNIVANLNM